MPSNTLAAFAAGLFVATLVLTHDASSGDELLVARGLLLPSSSRDLDAGVHASSSRNATAPDPNVVAACPSDAPDAPDGTPPPYPECDAITPPSTTTADATADADDARLARDAPAPSSGTREPFDPLTTREAFAAALASTRLALRLWARAARPVTDALEWYTRAGAREFAGYLWRLARMVAEAPPRVLAGAGAGVAALVAARLAATALLRHLRRARYRARAREALARQRRRILDARDRAIAPFVAVARRVSNLAGLSRRRYASFIKSVKAKSRVAALLAPHVILFAVGGVLIVVLPRWARACVRKREVVASATLLVPTFFTVSALEKCRAAGAARGDPAGSAVAKPPPLPPRPAVAAKAGSGVGAHRAGRVVDARASSDSKVPSTFDSLVPFPGHANDSKSSSTPCSPERALEAAEAWLRFWASAAPLMLVLDVPFVATGVHLFVPFWPELTLLWTAWLTFPMTAGAKLLTEAASPRLAGWPPLSAREASAATRAGSRTRAGFGAKKETSEPTRRSRSVSSRLSFPSAVFFREVRRMLYKAAHRSLRNVAWGLHLTGFRRAGFALGLAAERASLPTLGCCVFFFTPPFLTSYGAATAALALPAAASVDALRLRDLDGGLRDPSERSRKICAQLRYWLAYSLVWSFVRELSRGALSWFPLWRHVELAFVFWLAVFGGADEVTERVFAAKEGIVSEHNKAAARARVAKEAARLERGSGRRDSLGSAASGAASENESLVNSESEGGGPAAPPRDGDAEGEVGGRGGERRGGFGDVGLTEETLRRRATTATAGRE